MVHRRSLTPQTGSILFNRSTDNKIPYIDSVETLDDDLTDIDDDEEYKKCDCFGTDAQSIIPYKTIYDVLDESVLDRIYFIPGRPVTATIVSAIRDDRPIVNLFRPYYYTILLEHAGQSWTVNRKYAEFQRLHNRLALFMATQKMGMSFMKGIFQHHEEQEPGTIDTLTLDKESGLIPMGGLTLDKPSSAKEVFKYVSFDEEPQKATEEPPEDPTGAGSVSSKMAETPVSQKSFKGRKTHRIPKFPFKPEAFIGDLQARRNDLQKYIAGILHIPVLRNHRETAAFLDVSRLSFVNNLEHKFKEGVGIKKPGGHLDYQSCRRCLKERCGKWNERWFLSKDTFFAYLHPGTDLVREVMLYDAAFGAKVTVVPGKGITRHAVQISNFSRELLMQCKTQEEAQDWKKGIDEAFNANLGANWKEINSFGSSYPPRPDSYAHWLVDGKSYMEHVAHCLEYAKEEILIGGWFITAEIFLKRPAKKQDPWQLMNVLKRKAEQGVYVFVMFYKEYDLVMDNGSNNAKRILKMLHPKIIVARHPEHKPIPQVWAHHEKIVIIDQSIAFAAGIDLSYGRWDNHFHWLTDLGNRSKPRAGSLNQRGVEATDYCPVLPKPYQSASQGLVTPPQLITRLSVDPDQTSPSSHDNESFQMDNFDEPSPKPDEAVASEDAGSPDSKCPLSESDLQKINEFINSDKRQKIRSRLDTPPKRMREKFKRAYEEWKNKTPDNDPRHWFHEYERMVDEINAIQEKCMETAEGELWIGKDYTNWFIAYVKGYELPYIDQFDRTQVPRTPWHDVGCVVYGRAARDMARHFIQRWNACKEEKSEEDDGIPYLMPKSYVHLKIPQFFSSFAYPCIAQILRSGYKWSTGMSVVEDSIHQAYRHIITNAKHYIYIENQFFVTLIGSPHIKNSVGQAIFDRIVKAHKNKENFRVYVLLPLMPCFEGELGELSGLTLQTMLYNAYTSICRGKEALLVHLQNTIGDYSNFIHFYGLRTFDDLCGRLITETVYIHAKTIVVDDRYAIIGSANINDRSLLGDRDSEVAIYVEDTQFVDSRMDGKEYKAGKFGRSFRIRLMGEHFGILDENEEYNATSMGIDLLDPVVDYFWDLFRNTAASNTEIYDVVFKCYPTDNVKNWDELKRYKQEAKQLAAAVTDRAKADRLLKDIRGYLIEFPLKFLEDVDLRPDSGLIPDAWKYPLT